ncbi:hypothetical protein CU044_7301 [Streptomyces sp. L-9-10]|uniref:hypothetical protein n=1 Tax=Streptomyces sp. L-9-10 TaxID=1478131 RepID=UPI0010DEC926|nr:hypothetical protein [Streptomyces sp. L-9-10]RYJ20309.1 hypothetical protein CU044_7301 [Streptomyces sp. L-9-10]
MAETFADLIAAEDVLLFVNAAVTATGQREFRSDAHTQRLSLGFLHEYVRVNYRPVYAAALALDINDHNAALIIEQLLRTPGEASAEEKRAEGRLIAARLTRLTPQRVYRLFRGLRAAGVGNRRTRAILRDWLTARPDLGHDAVKYRGALTSVARHFHLPLGRLPLGRPALGRPAPGRPAPGLRAPGRPSDEIGDFLFSPGRRDRYDHPLLDAYRRAHFEQGALYELPFTVAEGFAAKHGIARDAFLERIRHRMTRLERLRTERAAKTVRRTDLTVMPLTRLALYVLSLTRDERVARRAELTRALRTAALRVAGPHRHTWGRVAAVLDDSYSSSGSGEKRRRPLGTALACHFLLEALAAPGAYAALWTSGGTDPLLVRPYGPTPLGTRIIDALDHAPDRLVIVSDGWDNAPPGLAGEVLRVWRTRLDLEGRTSVVHLNPVYDADGFDVRRLAASVPTAGIRDAEDLPALVEIAQFAEGRTGLAELRAYLDGRVRRFVDDDLFCRFPGEMSETSEMSETVATGATGAGPTDEVDKMDETAPEGRSR